MFYRPAEGHGLPHNPFNAIIAPRPIGWISTQDAEGRRNLAPYSFFNAVAYVPPQVMFASTGAKADQDGTKDSVSNIRKTGVFCVNIVEYAMLDAMNASSASLQSKKMSLHMQGSRRWLVTPSQGFALPARPPASSVRSHRSSPWPGRQILPSSEK